MPKMLAKSRALAKLIWADTSGAILPYVTVMLVVIVGTPLLALDVLPFQFFFLGGLMGFSNIMIPPMTTTITGEDLSSSRPTT